MKKQQLQEAIPGLLHINGSPVIRPNHAADLLCVSRNSVRSWIARGLLKTVRLHGEVLLEVESLLSFQPPKGPGRPALSLNHKEETNA